MVSPWYKSKRFLRIALFPFMPLLALMVFLEEHDHSIDFAIFKAINFVRNFCKTAFNFAFFLCKVSIVVLAVCLFSVTFHPIIVAAGVNLAALKDLHDVAIKVFPDTTSMWSVIGSFAMLTSAFALCKNYGVNQQAYIDRRMKQTSENYEKRRSQTSEYASQPIIFAGPASSSKMDW